MEWLASHALAIGSALLAALWAAVGIVVRQRAVRGAGGVILALAVGAMTAATIALGRDSASVATSVADAPALVTRAASA